MDPKALAKSLKEIEAHHRGAIKLRVIEVAPPAVDVKRIRSSLGLSQQEFAARFSLSLATVRNWEQGSREPEGPARTLLALIDKNPKLIEAEIKKLRATA